MAALEAYRRAGARTCLITASGSSGAHRIAELVYPTPLEDASWCHTVGYLSPMLAGAAIAASLARAPLDAEELSAQLAACDAELEPIAASVAPFAGMARLLSVGSGLDAISAAEQALKIEEGAWIPTTSLHLETLLHGHLPAADAQTGLIAFLLDPRAPRERAARTLQALQAARAVGVVPLLVTSADYLPELAGESGPNRVVLPAAAARRRSAPCSAGALALQRITLALSAAAGHQPRPAAARRRPLPHRGPARRAQAQAVRPGSPPERSAGARSSRAARVSRRTRLRPRARRRGSLAPRRAPRV